MYQLYAKLKWTDPPDILTNEPVPCIWAGTVVVRKEGSVPINKFDGELLVDSTIRNQYAEIELIDDTIEPNKDYYYGIFPYDTRGWHRYTKVIHVDTTLIHPRGTSILEDIKIMKVGGDNTSTAFYDSISVSRIS